MFIAICNCSDFLCAGRTARTLAGIGLNHMFVHHCFSAALRAKRRAKTLGAQARAVHSRAAVRRFTSIAQQNQMT